VAKVEVVSWPLVVNWVVVSNLSVTGTSRSPEENWGVDSRCLGLVEVRFCAVSWLLGLDMVGEAKMGSGVRFEEAEDGCR